MKNKNNNVLESSSPSVPFRWKVMIILLLANFMTILDASILNVALPSLQSYFENTEEQLSWVVTSYIIAFAIGLIPFGRLGDSVGRRKIFILGLLGFTITSTLCGISSTINDLIALRSLQGLTAAMLTPQILAIAVTIFTPNERPRIFSTFGFIAGFAAIFGSILCGILLHVNPFGLGWRLCFLINLPIGLIIILFSFKYIPESKSDNNFRLDFLGILLMTMTIFSFIYPLIESSVNGWPTWYFILISLSFLCFLIFIKWEFFQDKKRNPLLFPIYLVKNKNYLIGGVSILFLFFILQGFLFILAIFLQKGLSYSSMKVAIVISFFSIGVAAAIMVNVFISNLKFKIITGATLFCFSFIFLYFLIQEIESFGNCPYIIISLFLGGVGNGMLVSSLFQTITRTVLAKDMGAASGSLQVLQQIGAIIGVAFTSNVFFSENFHIKKSGFNDSIYYLNAMQDVLIYFILVCIVILFLSLKINFSFYKNKV
ncbi:MFS transporter [Xenorhabdus sp. SGI246]|uniref:MFS transporter n=1 Tax=Xenorhabdus sp. SGI246 TaxID=3158263 RepID=UPI00349F5D04